MRKANWFELSGRCEKSAVKLQCLTGEGKLGWDQIIGNFEKQRAQEIDVNKAIYTRKKKTHLSLDVSQLRHKLSRINGTLRRDLAKTHLTKEQVLGAVLR